jgi:hypothetical protein
MPNPSRACLPLVVMYASLVVAEDRAAPVRKPDAVAQPPAGSWSMSGRVGAFFANVATTNADTSRDSTIAGTGESTSYLFTYEGRGNWRSEHDSIDNLLKARYGRLRTESQEWQENHDEIRYDGVYRREILQPHFVYLGWGAESVFTGFDPHNHPLDPTTGKVSSGYGQRYEDFLPDKNHCEGRVGARAQQRWGSSVAGENDEIETGLEAFLRYEHLLKRNQGEYDVRFFAQYEGFSEFDDVKHVTNLVTAGLTMQLTRYIAVELGLRGFYESRPKSGYGTVVGYDEWSVRQDSLFGLTYSY